MDKPEYTQSDEFHDLVKNDPILRHSDIDMDVVMWKVHQKEEPYIRDGDLPPKMSEEEIRTLLTRYTRAR